MRKGAPLKTKIFIEDSYGPSFINKLILKLKEIKLVKKEIEITCDKFEINRLERLIKAQIVRNSRIIVISLIVMATVTREMQNIL